MSCGTDDTNDPVLARAFDNELHWSDLRQVIPVSSTEMDSAALAQRYITNWSRDQVLVHRAEQNLGEEQKDFVAQLEDYRKDRLIYAYEEALVSQKLDTVVSDPEIEAYWKENEACTVSDELNISSMSTAWEWTNDSANEDGHARWAGYQSCIARGNGPVAVPARFRCCFSR